MIQSQTVSLDGPQREKGSSRGRGQRYYEIILRPHELVGELQVLLSNGYSIEYLSWWQQIMTRGGREYEEGCWYEVPEDDDDKCPHQVELVEENSWLLDLIEDRRRDAERLQAVQKLATSLIEEKIARERHMRYSVGPKRKRHQF